MCVCFLLLYCDVIDEKPLIIFLRKFNYQCGDMIFKCFTVVHA